MDYQNYNDFELVYLVEEKNEDAFQILYKKYEPIIRKMVGSFYISLKKYGVEYDDLYQEAYLTFVKAIRFFNHNEDTIFYTFFNMSLKSKLLNYKRAILTKKGLFNAKMLSLNADLFDNDENTLLDFIEDKNQVNPIYDLEYTELNFKLNNFCIELPDTQGQVFELMYNGFTTSEISNLLEIPPKIVSNTIYKIRKKLKLYLAH